MKQNLFFKLSLVLLSLSLIFTPSCAVKDEASAPDDVSSQAPSESAEASSRAEESSLEEASIQEESSAEEESLESKEEESSEEPIYFDIKERTELLTLEKIDSFKAHDPAKITSDDLDDIVQEVWTAYRYSKEIVFPIPQDIEKLSYYPIPEALLKSGENGTKLPFKWPPDTEDNKIVVKTGLEGDNVNRKYTYEDYQKISELSFLYMYYYINSSDRISSKFPSRPGGYTIIYFCNDRDREIECPYLIYSNGNLDYYPRGKSNEGYSISIFSIPEL